MAQRSRALTAPVEVRDLIPSTHVGQITPTCSSSSPGGRMPFSDHCGTHTHTHMGMPFSDHCGTHTHTHMGMLLHTHINNKWIEVFKEL